MSSLGPGTACKVELRLMFEPDGETRTWATPFLLPGEKVAFRPPRREGETEFKLENLAREALVVRLEGSMEDVEGDVHFVSDEVRIAEWWAAVTRSEQRYVEDLGERVVRELKKIRVALAEQQPFRVKGKRHAVISIVATPAARLAARRSFGYVAADAF